MGVVPGEGVEPSLPRGNWILNPARLPIPPSGQSVDIQQVDKADLHCCTCEKVKMYHFCISGKQKG